MQDYEIRILLDGRTRTLIEVLYINDQTAIRAAREIVGDRPFEVWRDLECIYGGPPRAAPPMKFTHAH